MYRPATLMLMLVTGLCACAAPSSGMLSVDEVRASGSLRGTDLDGAWDAPMHRREAEALLLRRFDHLLTAVGETGLPQLRRYVEREVSREQGNSAAQKALVAWDDHLAVLRGGTQLDGVAPEPSPRVPKRRPALPRTLLVPDRPGTEADAQALHALRVSQLGEAAAERLRAEDVVRWAWTKRLDEARAALQGLPHAAREPELAARFAGRELLRARTLLGLPPP